MRSTLSRFAPVLVVVALMIGLARLLDDGGEWGIGFGGLELAGRVYFVLLLLAPCVIYPFCLVHGETLRARIALSLAPGFLWWLTEVGLRLEGHSLGEALWLAASPVNAFHLYVAVLAMGASHLAVRGVQWLRGTGSPRVGLRAVAGAVALVVLPPIVIAAAVFPYLNGYQAVFQQGLLPMPEHLPGPLDPTSVDARPGERMNIVFILSDDHRFDFMGNAGHPFVKTPALDRLAGEGVRFDRAYVTSSLCSPSRASFLTGIQPRRHGVWNNFTPWSNENRTFFEYLKAVGYRTAFIGKWHMPGGLPELRGVDHFVTFTNMGGQGIYEWCPLVVDGEETPSRKRYIAEELTDRALEWIDAQGGAPFVLYLSHKNVHADFTPDEPERGIFADMQPALPPRSHPFSHVTDAQYVHLSFSPLDDVIRRYAETVTSMDRQIGRVLDHLDERGLAGRTLVIYTSDNGYLWGERGLVDKRWPYETSIRVPFLARVPGEGRPPGTRLDALVANIDVAPTLLDWAGIDPPESMDGRSLLPLLRGGDPSWREDLLYAYYFEPPYPTPTSHAVVTHEFKWIEFDGLGHALYDLEQDPDERVDLADDPAYAALREELTRRLSRR